MAGTRRSYSGKWDIYFKINAIDSYNKTAKEITGSITVNTSQLSKIIISNLVANPNPYSVKGTGGGIIH
jgi:hypothetical protein